MNTPWRYIIHLKLLLLTQFNLWDGMKRWHHGCDMAWILLSHNCPIVRAIHRSPVDSTHKGTVDVSVDVFINSLLNKLQARHCTVHLDSNRREWPGGREFLWSLLIMMTSSNENIFRVTSPLCGEFPGSGEFPVQRPVTRSFDVFFDLRLKNGWVNNREADDLRPHRAHYVM